LKKFYPDNGELKQESEVIKIVKNQYSTSHLIPIFMKKIYLSATLVLFFFGCTMNPSKEARIQKLEIEIQQAIEKINSLESRIESLEEINEQLNTKILELEKR
jgi:TolA-binding protein